MLGVQWVALELLAKPCHVRVDRPTYCARVIPPDVAKELRARDDAVVASEQGDQEIEFLRSKIDRRTSASDGSGSGVDFDVPEANPSGLEVLEPRAGAAQQRPDAGEQLQEAHRLDDEVVRTHAEAPERILLVSTRGQHYDGDVDAFRSHLVKKLVPTAPGQHNVEDDESRCQRPNQFAPHGGVRGDVDLEPFDLQVAAKRRGIMRVVLNQDDAHRYRGIVTRFCHNEDVTRTRTAIRDHRDVLRRLNVSDNLTSADTAPYVRTTTRSRL